MTHLKILPILALLLIGGCEKNNYYQDSPSSPTSPSTSTSVEYRASGTFTSVIIKFTSSQDGTNQVVTSLPWSNTVVLAPNANNVFLSIEVTPLTISSSPAPFVTVQIFVNGTLLREANSNSFNPVLVSATYRR